MHVVLSDVPTLSDSPGCSVYPCLACVYYMSLQLYCWGGSWVEVCIPMPADMLFLCQTRSCIRWLKWPLICGIVIAFGCFRDHSSACNKTCGQYDFNIYNHEITWRLKLCLAFYLHIVIHENGFYVGISVSPYPDLQETDPHKWGLFCCYPNTTLFFYVKLRVGTWWIVPVVLKADICLADEICLS